MRCPLFQPPPVTAVEVPCNDSDVERVDAYTLAVFDSMAWCVCRKVCGVVGVEWGACAVGLWAAGHNEKILLASLTSFLGLME